MRDFDFVGLFTIVAGVVLILLGFNFSETSCESASLYGVRDFVRISAVFRGYSPMHRASRHWMYTLNSCVGQRIAAQDEVTYRPSSAIQSLSSIFLYRYDILIFLQTRTTALILVSVFIHAFGFFCGAYYLPVYYQVMGSSATNAGLRCVAGTIYGQESYVMRPFEHQDATILSWRFFDVSDFWTNCIAFRKLETRYVGVVGGHGRRIRHHDDA